MVREVQRAAWEEEKRQEETGVLTPAASVGPPPSQRLWAHANTYLGTSPPRVSKEWSTYARAPAIGGGVAGRVNSPELYPTTVLDVQTLAV